MTPLWSILLPTHKSPATISYAIQSVLIQEVTDFELLIVGDGCEDDTREVIASFDDPRIKFYDFEKAPGFGYANRNIALKEAKGELVAFISDDDIWLPDHLSILQDGFTDDRIDLVCTQSVWITPEGLSIPLPMNLTDNQVRRRFMAREFNFLPAGCVAHRRHCFDRVGYWSESLPSKGDLDLWIRILESGNEQNFHYVPLASNLHFRAPWKTLANEGPSEMKYWREFIENHEVPSILNRRFSEACNEQREFFELITSKGELFVRDYRRSLSVLIELSHRFERTQSVSLKRRFAEFKASVDEQERSILKELSDLKSERAELQSEYDTCLSRFESLRSDYDSCFERNQALQLEFDTLRNSYQSVVNSSSWRFAQQLQRLSAMLPVPEVCKAFLKGEKSFFTSKSSSKKRILSDGDSSIT